MTDRIHASAYAFSALILLLGVEPSQAGQPGPLAGMGLKI